MIVERYLTHTGPTNWIHFTNIGNWSKNTSNARRSRNSSNTQVGHRVKQYGNGISTSPIIKHSATAAAGRNPLGYVKRFRKDQRPRGEAILVSDSLHA
jgi:hypothetical protein